MTAILLLCCFVAPPAPPADPFLEASADLRQQETVTRRADLVVEWERLIAKHGNHPRVAEAMISLGHLLATEDLARDPLHKEDEAGSLAWFRKAARAAKPGSDLWVEAQFLVVARAMFANPAEARAMLKEIVARRSDSLSLIRVERELASICLCEGDQEGAVRHDRNRIFWYKHDPRKVPADPELRCQVDTEIRSACGGITQLMIVMPGTKRERADRLIQLSGEYLLLPTLQLEVERALKQLEAMPESVTFAPTLAVSPPYDPPPSTGVSRTRVALSAAGVVALAVVGCGLFVLRRRRRRALLAQPQ